MVIVCKGCICLKSSFREGEGTQSQGCASHTQEQGVAIHLASSTPDTLTVQL